MKGPVSSSSVFGIVVAMNGKSFFFREIWQRSRCTRSSKVFGLFEREGTSFINGTDAHWLEMNDYVLSKAKSGHALVTVPQTFAPSCKEN